MKKTRKEYYEADKARHIATVQRARRARYGWEPGRYEQMQVEQGGVCAICGDPPKQRQLSADHHHATLQARGLLCQRCNARVGWEESESEYRKKVQDYIADWAARRA